MPTPEQIGKAITDILLTPEGQKDITIEQVMAEWWEQDKARLPRGEEALPRGEQQAIKL